MGQAIDVFQSALAKNIAFIEEYELFNGHTDHAHFTFPKDEDD
jgi:hypothetical protein